MLKHCNQTQSRLWHCLAYTEIGRSHRGNEGGVLANSTNCFFRNKIKIFKRQMSALLEKGGTTQKNNQLICLNQKLEMHFAISRNLIISFIKKINMVCDVIHSFYLTYWLQHSNSSTLILAFLLVILCFHYVPFLYVK